MLGIATRVVQQRNDNKGWKSDDLKAIDKLKLWEQSEAKQITTGKRAELEPAAASTRSQMYGMTPPCLPTSKCGSIAP